MIAVINNAHLKPAELLKIMKEESYNDRKIAKRLGFASLHAYKFTVAEKLKF